MPEEITEEPEIPLAPTPNSELSADTEAALELAFWDGVRDGSPAELESYLEKSGGHIRASRESEARVRRAFNWRLVRSDVCGDRPKRSRSCLLQYRQGQQSARGTAGLSGATSKWPLCRSGPGASCIPRSDLASLIHDRAGSWLRMSPSR